MKFRVIKLGEALFPFDDEAKEIIKKWKQGNMVLVEAKRPRNYEHHKKYFALLNIIYENTEHFESFEEIQTYFKIKIGIYKTIKVEDKFYPMVGSISWATMNQDAFSLFYSKAVDIALQLVPIGEDELAYKVARFGN